MSWRAFLVVRIVLLVVYVIKHHMLLREDN